MAKPATFVYDFRLAISNMLAGFDRVQALVAQATAMGWQESDFREALVNEDISSAEFYAAVQACAGLNTGFQQIANTLAKMRS